MWLTLLQCGRAHVSAETYIPGKGWSGNDAASMWPRSRERGNWLLVKVCVTVVLLQCGRAHVSAETYETIHGNAPVVMIRFNVAALT